MEALLSLFTITDPGLSAPPVVVLFLMELVLILLAGSFLFETLAANFLELGRLLLLLLFAELVSFFELSSARETGY